MTQELPWFVGEAGIDAYLRRDNYIILDFETTNKQYGTPTNTLNDLVLGCWTVVKDGFTVHKHRFGNEYCYQDLLDDIEKADFIVAHNAQFELGWLSRCGLDLHDVLVYDTMTAEWVIHGNQIVPFNLEDTSKRYGYSGKESLVSRMIKMGVSCADIPRGWLLTYCKKDVELTHQLFLRQKKALDDLDLWHIVLSRNLVIPVLTDIMLAGLYLDEAAVSEEHKRLQELSDTLGEELDGYTGGINLNSPKQLSKFLYTTLGFAKIRDRRGEAISSTSQDVIAQLTPTSEKQVKFLELYKQYNKATTLLSKTLNYMMVVCSKYAGKFFGQIVQGRTRTHRLAGSGISIVEEKKQYSFQLQNIPRQYKRFFVAQTGWKVLEFDGAGMEFRIATILGRDKQGEYDIVNGTDIHAFTRDTMNAAYKKYKIDKEIDRQEAKSSTFTPLFWGQGKDEAEQEYAKAFAQKYSGIRQVQEQWVAMVADKKYLDTPYGMRFYWPNARMLRNGYVTHTTEIVNLPIQGLATAECIPISLVHFWHRTRFMPVQLFNTVHDSGVCRVRGDAIEDASQAAKLAMTTDVYNFLKEVYRYDTGTCPLGVGIKVGDAWGESDDEVIYDVWNDGHERKTVKSKKETVIEYDTRSNT